MATKIQKHAVGLTRAIVEGAAAERELAVNADDDHATGEDLELLLDWSGLGDFLHFPSAERMAYTGAGKSGAEVVGVEDNFDNFSGGGTLQACLEAIDAFLSTVSGVTNAILKTGTVDMEADWNCQAAVQVNNPDSVPLGHDFGMLGDAIIADDLGSESISNGGFADATRWSLAYGFSVASGKLVYGFTVGTGLAEQAYTDLDAQFYSGEWYLLEMDISDITGTPVLKACFNTTPADYLTIPMTAGTYRKVFKMPEGAYNSSFQFQATGTTGDGVKIDNLSIKRYTGGELNVAGYTNNIFARGLRRNLLSTGDASYTAKSTDDIILAYTGHNDVTVNLPSVYSCGQNQMLTIKNSNGSNDVIIDPFGAETIEGAATYTLAAGTQQAVELIGYVGLGWYIIGAYTP